MPNNRLKNATADYKLLIVQRPQGWKPKNYFEEPKSADVKNEYIVASYQEAHDDMERCNRLSMHYSLDAWAIIQSPDRQTPRILVNRPELPPEDHA